MNKSELKAAFINAKATDAKYIGVSIQSGNNGQPEILINPRENFDVRFENYMQIFDDDLVLKRMKNIRITAAGYGNSFEDIESQLIEEKGEGWKKLIVKSIDKAYSQMIAKTPPKNEEEKVNCEMMIEGIKGMFINGRRTATEARFICEHIKEYDELFEICMNGDDLAFKRGLVKLTKMQNDYILQQNAEKDGEKNE